MNGNQHDVVQVCAKVTREQRDMLNSKAKSAGITAKDFLQKLIVDGQVIAASPGVGEEIRKANAWLGRINSNANMLAKWANIHKENAFADLILMRLALIHKDLSQVVSFTGDLRTQGFGRRRRKKGDTT